MRKIGLANVVGNELCSGCGVCAGMFSGAIRMTENRNRQYVPELVAGTDWGNVPEAATICPFSGLGQNENELGRALFGSQSGIRSSPYLGFHLEAYAAWVTDESDRLRSSSGGMATWFFKTLLERKLVDGIVCVAPVRESGTLFRYAIIREPDELDACRKSRYYPVEMSEVIQLVLANPGRYAVSVLPCFAKGLRLAMQKNHILNERICYIASLFCGHLKTKQYAEYLIRRCEVNREQVVAVDFRAKLRGAKASEYIFETSFQSASGAIEKRRIYMNQVSLGNWGLNGFMLKACECCDDVVGETADISFGDAWIPEYASDYRGTNVVICRRRDVLELLQASVDNNQVKLVPLTEARVRISQDAGFRQRRQGLAYRLHLAQKHDEWRPAKRVGPGTRTLAFYPKLMQHIRIKTAHVTKQAFSECGDDLNQFHHKIRFWVKLHDLLYKSRAWFRRLKRRQDTSGEKVKS